MHIVTNISCIYFIINKFMSKIKYNKLINTHIKDNVNDYCTVGQLQLQ